jgi:hypothetical protein
VSVEEPDAGVLLREIVDYVMKVLPPYETSVYLYLIRQSWLNGSSTVRVGIRSVGEGLGKGTRSTHGNYQHITEKLKVLETKGFIRIGDRTRKGTLFTVMLPAEVPAVKELLPSTGETLKPGDHYLDPALREELFERDGWICHYCAETVTTDTVTLDHIVPISRGGTNAPENLVTACLICNSIKADRTYEEAAADILAALVERRRNSPDLGSQRPGL